MARIHELMAQGVAAPVARMLGSNTIASVPAGGTTQATATPLPINFAVLTNTGAATQGVRLPSATGAALSVFYNSGPNPLLIYPDAADAFQDAQTDLPLTLQVHGTAVLVPSGNCWLVATTVPPGFTTPPVPGGSSGQVQVNSGGQFQGVTMSGDGVWNTGTGQFTLTALAGHPLSGAAPLDGQVLAWSAANNAWGPSPGIPGPVGPVGPIGPTGPTGPAGSVIVAATPPVTTTQGQLWWSSTDGQLYLYFNDGNSSQYVIANSTPGGLGTTIPDAPNDAYFYGRSGLAWQRVLGLAGGTLTGAVIAAADPTVPLGLATKQYVDTHSGGTITGVTAGAGLTGGGTTGTVTVSLSAPVLVANGGTGQSTLPASQLLLGNGTAAVTGVALPLGVANGGSGVATLPAGQLLQGNGTSAVTGVALPLSVANGGTGQTGMTPGALIRGAGTSTAPFVASAINDLGLGVTIATTPGGTVPGAPGTAGSLILPGPLVVNKNAAALPAPLTGTLLQIGNADAAATSILMDGFGAGASTSITGRHAMGTNAAKLPTSAGIGLLALNGGGYDGTAYSSGGQAQVALTALNTWSTTDHSTNIGFSTTPPASTTMALRMILGQGLQISSVIGTDPGPGALILNANAAALPAPIAGALLQIGTADGVNTRNVSDAFGAPTGWIFRSCGGTNAAKTATGVGNIGTISAEGYDGTAYSTNASGGSINFGANGTWSATSHPSQITMSACAVNATAPTQLVLMNPTNGCQFLGTQTNDNAFAGYVGEVIISTLGGPGISLTSGTAATVTTITLTPGDWDVHGTVAFSPAGTTTQSVLGGSISTAPGGEAGGTDGVFYMSASFTTGWGMSFPCGPKRVQASANTTVYLSATANFGVSTMQAYGQLWARRRR